MTDGERMNEKRGMLYIAAGMVVILVISLLISLDGDGSDTIICIFPLDEQTQYVVTTVTTEPVTEKKTEASETSAAENTTVSAAEEPLYININTAGTEELQRLYGIGPALAEAIIAYRTESGDFENIEEIMLVSGIGEGIFNRICNNIYVDNPVYTEPPEPISEPETTAETETQTEYQRTLEEAAPININTADAEELMLLPYVTKEIAYKIIELRERIHGFSHVYELLYVEELEQNQVAEIIEFVTVGQ